jgi:N-acetylglucosaminyl-diphospho-decaprenol L-rhamnosyltransferase
MVKRAVFEQVGLFSEDYFMYAEDVDLGYKIRLAGHETRYVPDAIVLHHGGSSSKAAVSTFTAVMMPEATLRFLTKSRGATYASAYRFCMGVAAIGRLLALAIAAPFYLRGRQYVTWSASTRKWLAVLRWSVRRDGLVSKYYAVDTCPS